MNYFQIQVLTLAVVGLLFMLVGIELEALKRKVNKTINVLKETLKELARIYPLD